MTTVSFYNNQIWINGKPSYAGRTYQGLPVEGLLFNIRAVQATFDDQNPDTRKYWAYPDTGQWDPERNVTEFMAALPEWRDHGILGVTLNFQGGGGCYRPEIYDHYDNSGFTPDGVLKPAYADRMARVLEKIDSLGMVAIVGIFYLAMANQMTRQESLWQAARSTLAFLADRGHENILIEIANETNIGYFKHPIFEPENAIGMIRTLRGEYQGFYYSTSLVGMDPDSLDWLPTSEFISACDYLLIHGNNHTPVQLARAIDGVLANPEMQRDPKPLIINEDSPGLPNLEVAWRRYVSWGYYDQGNNGEETLHPLWVESGPKPREEKYEELNGFQTPPVNWGINTPEKKAFFDRVAEITGFRGI
jgi:hypothetical protein